MEGRGPRCVGHRAGAYSGPVTPRLRRHPRPSLAATRHAAALPPHANRRAPSLRSPESVERHISRRHSKRVWRRQLRAYGGPVDCQAAAEEHEAERRGRLAQRKASQLARVDRDGIGPCAGSRGLRGGVEAFQANQTRRGGADNDVAKLPRVLARPPRRVTRAWRWCPSAVAAGIADKADSDSENPEEYSTLCPRRRLTFLTSFR
jgi:hypothetical protein